MLFKIEDLEQFFDKSRGNVDNAKVIDSVNTDSRKVAPQSLFIPIVGETFNGHDYVEQAIENGAVAVVWDEKEELPTSIPADFPVFFTRDTIESLQKIAKGYRDLIQPIVIGITGSNGKTTTKDLVAAIMKTTYRTHSTLGNLNNHIGLPLTILSMPGDTELLVLEMGMSGFDEIDVLTRIGRPDYAIITNVGESHIEFLGSREGIAKAKLEIVNGIKEQGMLIIDGDEPLLKEIHTNEALKTKKVGFHDGNDYQIKGVDITIKGTTFMVENGETYQIPLFGRHHAKNASFALVLAEQLNISIEKQKEGLQSLEHTSMRFELLKARNESFVVDDSYNASPTSMKGAIEIIKHMEDFKKKILVLGDVLELGSFAEKMHRDIASSISEPITHLYTYGASAAYITDEISDNRTGIHTAHYQSKEMLVEDLKSHLDKNTIVLFKASRGLAFESMVEKLITDDRI